MAKSDEGVTEEILEVGRTSRLPWVLFVVALAVGATATTLLVRRVEAVIAERESERASLREDERALRASLEQERASVVELQAKLASAERQNSVLATRGDDLALTVQAKDDELAKLRATATELEEKMNAPAVETAPSKRDVAGAERKKRAKTKLASAKPAQKKSAKAR